MQPTAVNAILSELRALQAQGRTLVSLMRGEPDFPTPPHIVAAATRAALAGRTGYPDNRGEKALREAVALKLQRDNGLVYDAGTEILITTGATFGIYAALMALVNEGDEVLLPDPIYDAYQSPVRLAGGRCRAVSSSIVQGRFALTAEALEAAWSPAAKLLILNTPWNPVGTVATPAELLAIADFCERRNLLLLTDEIYEAITYDDHRHVSPLAASPALRGRAVLVNSLSKTYAMTGWRVGYCAGPAAIIDAMYLILAQSSRGPATFIQDAAAEALTGPQDCVATMLVEYSRRRNLVLSTIPEAMAPEGGFFAMLDLRHWGMPSNLIRQRLMQEFGVVTVHGAAYGQRGEGTLRVSFASGGDISRSWASSIGRRLATDRSGAPVSLVQIETGQAQARLVNSKLLQAELQQVVEGHVRFDQMSRALYSTDASVYKIDPIGLVIPKNRQDIVRTIEICHRLRCPLTLRGGGTAQAGQAIGDGLQIDVSKHYNQVLEVNAEERWVRVEPGIVLDELNAKLAPLGLRFAPDISTASRATIGGMIANNSSGARSVLYGITLHHVLEQTVASGRRLPSFISPIALAINCPTGDGLEAASYRTVIRIR